MGATGERLTATTFEQYRKQHGIVIVHMIRKMSSLPPLRVRSLSSRAMLRMQNGHGHPRSASFARVLGHYVRDTHALSLMDALTKMTLCPRAGSSHASKQCGTRVASASAPTRISLSSTRVA